MVGLAYLTGHIYLVKDASRFPFCFPMSFLNEQKRMKYDCVCILTKNVYMTEEVLYNLDVIYV